MKDHHDASSSLEVEDVEGKVGVSHSTVPGYVPDTEEEKKLVRKIDLYILPMMWVMYLLSYMDRTNIGNARVAGMDVDLDLDSNRYSIALVVFFIGYVVFEVPSNMLLARIRPSIYLPSIMFAWGVVTIGMAFVKDYKGLIGFRVAMGILEAGFAPGMLLLLNSWYKKAEQSKRFAVYISAAILSGAFGGLIAGGIVGGLDGAHGMAGWRWLFIVEGAATAGVSIIASFVLPDFPSSTSKLNERERELAVARMAADSLSTATDDDPSMTHLQALKLSLSVWKTWFFVVGYMAIVGSSTLSYFYPTLVKGLGYTGNMAQYMVIPIYAVAFVCTAITGYIADKQQHLRGYYLAAWMTVAMVCAVITCAVYDLKGRYALLVIMASGLWASNGLSLSYASINFAEMPREARAISLALVNAMGNLAQIYGAYLFPDDDKPKYLMGFGVISGLCFTGVISYLALQLLLKPSSRRV
ncbi:major facilitator superfamily domain-containing protein [Aspergillus pseudodeflectus]|uniref:Major facilitator superfamily domain-containing protein n=1 Tax=Aspergillus pseudodeflectus TaxID=176178 RepID=A0ABR4JYE2_9EURO